MGHIDLWEGKSLALLIGVAAFRQHRDRHQWKNLCAFVGASKRSLHCLTHLSASHFLSRVLRLPDPTSASTAL